jgi:hypothetical protein
MVALLSDQINTLHNQAAQAKLDHANELEASAQQVDSARCSSQKML